MYPNRKALPELRFSLDDLFYACAGHYRALEAVLACKDSSRWKHETPRSQPLTPKNFPRYSHGGRHNLKQENPLLPTTSSTAVSNQVNSHPNMTLNLVPLRTPLPFLPLLPSPSSSSSHSPPLSTIFSPRFISRTGHQAFLARQALLSSGGERNPEPLLSFAAPAPQPRNRGTSPYDGNNTEDFSNGYANSKVMKTMTPRD